MKFPRTAFRIFEADSVSSDRKEHTYIFLDPDCWQWQSVFLPSAVAAVATEPIGKKNFLLDISLHISSKLLITYTTCFLL